MRRRLLFPLLLLLAVFAVYFPALKAGYTNWDDPDYTYNNPALKNPAAVFFSVKVGHYHPLTDLSLALESAVLGEKAAVHHAGNVLLHGANAALVYLLLAALLGAELPALAGALLWALHPVNVESAAWIAERKNLLYAFFYLAALLAYLRLAGGARKSALVFGLFTLSLLSKASAVTLPLALLALDWLNRRPLDRRNLLEKGALFGLALLFALLAAAAQGARGQLLPASFTGLFSFYVLKALWPARLCALYPYADALAAIKGNTLLYALPAAAYAGALAWAVKKNRTAAFGLLFFLVNILPFALLIPIGPALAADRYLYLALAGLAAAACAALTPPPNACRAHKAGVAALLLVCLPAAGALTAGRLKTWRSSETLWADVLEKYPGSETANLNMAHALLETGRWPAAQGYLVKTLAINPSSPAALYDLGTALAMAGRPAEALPLLHKAAFLKPENAMAWNNLGRVQLQLGRPDEARKAFLTATAADPAYQPAYAGLAAADAALRGRGR
jgi:Tfp pilus assembly protein PilF